MKKLVRLLICAGLMALSAMAFAASKKSIVCVTYPEYDWVMNILGKKASSFNVSLIQNSGADMHSFSPSVKDVAKVSSCDLLVYVGGESDEWVENALAKAKKGNGAVVNMMTVLGEKVRAEEVVEGMQVSEHHHHHDEDAEGHHHHDEKEYDEHVWLSVKNAIIITGVLSEKIQQLDPANAGIYKANAAAYIKELSALDRQFEKAVAASGKKVLLFGDRYPFRYLSDDYGLKYYAAFVGCSAESEASFKTIAFLSKKVDELGLNTILTIEKSDKKIAKTIISNTKKKNQQILEMDSLQSVSKKEIKAGRNYLSAMKKNLEVLKKALK